MSKGSYPTLTVCVDIELDIDMDEGENSLKAVFSADRFFPCLYIGYFKSGWEWNEQFNRVELEEQSHWEIATVTWKVH